ncbi:asparaginase domain-containing protein [Sulfurimonas sp.]|uniref:asparaginase domain-containing protein n=1 Tax=Sulfurimonas sp. TaxID=2022749 RepID=UPI00356340A2
MLILNTGGTFNKRYNPLNGELEVPCDSLAVERILSSVESEYDMAGVMFKDSLDMDINDRKTLAAIIMESKDDKFLIVHGTDTMDETAFFLDEIFDDRTIVLTGAMKPFEIDNIEATFNLGMAMGFLNSKNDHGVYICMNGFVKKWNELKKNRELGKFELV